MDYYSLGWRATEGDCPASRQNKGHTVNDGMP